MSMFATHTEMHGLLRLHLLGSFFVIGASSSQPELDTVLIFTWLHGFSTLLDYLFHVFATVADDLAPWLKVIIQDLYLIPARVLGVG